jgi:carbonic anhydrase
MRYYDTALHRAQSTSGADEAAQHFVLSTSYYVRSLSRDKAVNRRISTERAAPCLYEILEREAVMSLIDHAIKANVEFAKKYDPKLGGHPQPKIAVVTCMDPRLSDLEGILGLKTADIDVIRTGGPAVTDDVLGELVVSTRVLGSKEIMLLNHTGCGFTTFTDKELNDKLARETGDATPVPMRLFSFKDPEENTRAQIAKVRSHPWIAKDVPVRGFIFDVDTGRLREVKHG